MALNARGPMICIREMLLRREAAPVQDARIILIASMAAQALAINSPASYVASKGALLALTRVAAGEASQFGVTVNAVAPGAIGHADVARRHAKRARCRIFWHDRRQASRQCHGGGGSGCLELSK